MKWCTGPPQLGREAGTYCSLLNVSMLLMVTEQEPSYMYIMYLYKDNSSNLQIVCKCPPFHHH